MITLRKMRKRDVPGLYEMAIRSFQPDYEKFGVYPPFIKVKNKGFLPPLILGCQVISVIEKQYPRVKTWKLETPADNTGLHRFYESLGFVKTGEMKDPKSGMVGYVYEKRS